jgi:O-antigen ligase
VRAKPAFRTGDLISAACWALLVGLLTAAGGITTSFGGRAVALLIGAAVAYTTGRLLPATLRPVVLAGILGGITALALLVPGMRSGSPTAEPLGYANANGALLATGVVAAAGIFISTTGRRRWVAGTSGVVLLAVLPATGSTAASALSVGVVLSTVAAVRSSTASRRVGAAAAAILAAVVTAPVVLGLGYTGPGSDAATDALSARRVDLWQDAVDITARDPITGRGIGSFRMLSPTVRSDPDTQFPHSLTLELAAEAGVPAALAAAVMLLALAVTPIVRSDPGAAVATAAVLVFAAQSAIDYTHHFVAVVLVASAVAGLTVGLRTPDIRGSTSDTPATSESHRP